MNHDIGWRLVGGGVPLGSVDKRMHSTWPWALHAAADDGAIEHAERSEQGGAVPVVVVHHGLIAFRRDREPGLGAVTTSVQ
jgi:hypothetical protein